MIVGYSSAIKIVAELADGGEVTTNVTRVVSCGEPLDTRLRRYIEKTLPCEVLNFYGASESLALGLSENENDGMYLFDDMNYIEVENGAMYLTSLYNFAQPLIRYKMSDQISLQVNDSNNRYPFTKAENILGRNEDIMWFSGRDGKREFVHPLSIEGICVEGLLDYQFVQIDDDSFEMLAEVSEPQHADRISSEILNCMKKILQEKQLENLQFYVRIVDTITPDPITGKKLSY